MTQPMLDTLPPETDVAERLLFGRHGATAPNLAGLRCGGDLDPPLAAVGREQAHALGRRLAATQPDIGVIVTSALARTRETAAIVAAALGGVEIVVEPLLAERRLGSWNLQPVALTLPWFEAGIAPPGGEDNAQFVARITRGIERLLPLLPRRALLIGSRGVARVLGELTGLPDAKQVGNAELVEFSMSRLCRAACAGGQP